MRILLGVIGAGLIALNAMAITYHADVHGTSAPSGSRFIPSGGNLELKLHNGFSALGISGGHSGREIDLGQRLRILFDQPQFLHELTVAFLYDGPEYNDGNEIAAIGIDGVTYMLTATGQASSHWTGNGYVQNVSPALPTAGGIWKIVNPAGGAAVSSIELYPMPYPVRKSAPNPSDFSLRQFSSTPVPETTASIILLALSIAALSVLTCTRGRW